jgi:dihydroorotate dehydrogenase
LKRSSQYQRYVLPLLLRVDPEATHDRTLSALALAQRWSAGRAILRRLAGNIPQNGVQLFGLNFPNILGVAAGFDKSVRVAPGLAILGFGHIETGTITPRPQVGNPKPRVFRLLQDEALINRMGFPNIGADAAVARLRDLAKVDRQYVLGVSIGKQKDTALADAVIDYLTVLHATYMYADYLAVNISSPNTPELRNLQGSRYLADLLSALMSESHMLAQKHGIVKRPLLVKIAPDLNWGELDSILQVALDQGVDGIIATNTTVGRAGLQGTNRSERGGMSGVPLSIQSTKIIRYIAQHTDGLMPIIGVGGIRSAADVQAKIDAGASLVQLYTGLVYQGPGLAGRILRSLKKSANVANLQT